jgi:hypothetical protein
MTKHELYYAIYEQVITDLNELNDSGWRTHKHSEYHNAIVKNKQHIDRGIINYDLALAELTFFQKLIRSDLNLLELLRRRDE